MLSLSALLSKQPLETLKSTGTAGTAAFFAVPSAPLIPFLFSLTAPASQMSKSHAKGNEEEAKSSRKI